jgi:2-isopropylmalate synthase
MSKERVYLFDTTLRDGAQTNGVDFTLHDKIAVAKLLDGLGVDYIEGGYPGANPTDTEFFSIERDYDATFTAFGMTRRPGRSTSNDPGLATLLDAKSDAICFVAKASDYQVRVALQTTEEENLASIRDSVAAAKAHGKEVLLDCEHFFDGYKGNPTYAIACAKAAHEAGARWVVLCDTNGGTLPDEIATIVGEVVKHVPGTHVGIHAHNDTEQAVANSFAAVRAGARQIQGTLNGIGERCGNANLVSIIPTLQLKMKLDCIPEPNLRELRELSRFTSELANRKPWGAQPYVGDSAFAHKGGMHVSAVLKHPETYEHISPESVGNHRRVLVSELAGKSNVLYKAREYGIDLDRETPDSRRILDQLKALEDQGFQFEGAEASFELLMERALGRHRPYFELEAYRVIVEEQNASEEPVAEATVRVRVKGILEHTAAAGNGPVDALDHALRKALEEFYPGLREMKLLDYKVRILDESKGTAAKTRVLITSGDGRETWGTVGVADNIIEASWQALVDSVEYKLRADERRITA